ncbi:hypothetical protein PtB15_6B154 [Puccinia triticina]|nr:hypothetical protein PtB15_6B154 [Puccinia triticina]
MMTAVELRKVAQENSKGAMSAADQAAFIEFFHEQEQAMALKAIELQVSMPMVWAVLGRCVAIREANCWNQFLQTTQASGRGVKNKDVMKRLSAAYKLLSKDEKAALIQDIAEDSDEEDEDEEELAEGCEAQLDTATAAELALDEYTDDKEDPGRNKSQVFGGKKPAGIVRGTVSNLVRKNQVESALNQWSAEARNVATTCCCEIVMFAVSKHLSTNCFRLERCTPGAFKPNQEMSLMDGNNHYSACLQGLVTGNSVGELAVADKVPGNSKKGLICLRTELCAELKTFISRETKNVFTSWPWQDNCNKLRKAKFELVLAPKALSKIDWLRTNNKKLGKTDISALLLDLKDGLISLRRITSLHATNSQKNCPPSSLDDPSGLPGQEPSLNNLNNEANNLCQ